MNAAAGVRQGWTTIAFFKKSKHIDQEDKNVSSEGESTGVEGSKPASLDRERFLLETKAKKKHSRHKKREPHAGKKGVGGASKQWKLA